MPFGSLLQTGLHVVRSPSERFVALAATDHATCAVAATGTVYCWGSNASGELGVTSAGVCRFFDPYYVYFRYAIACNTTPTRVVDLPVSPPPVAIAADSAGTVCAWAQRGDTWCWGTSGSPNAIPGVLLTEVWVVGNVVCRSRDDDSVLCWWLRGSIRPTARPFGDDIALVALSKGDGHACGLSRGTMPLVYCWGENARGQLGDGTLTSRQAPVPVALVPRPPS